VVSSIVTIWPPQKKIALGLDIQGGTSFLIRLKGGDKEVTKGMLDQAVEVIRKRIDTFGVSEPIISPVANDRILVQIPGLDTAKIQEARDQLSRVAKLEFRLVESPLRVSKKNQEKNGCWSKRKPIYPAIAFRTQALLMNETVGSFICGSTARERKSSAT
ncbi:MAG: hypothetical protein DMF20_11635, partial [Verrucomicrobia bacterium]